MIDIYKAWIGDFGIDGFRIDTVKHVNVEFWQQFAPGDPAARRAPRARRTSSCSARSSTRNPALHVALHDGRRSSRRCSTSRFQGSGARLRARAATTDALRDLFADDDCFTDADSNAYALPTFLGNHDMGRIGYFLAPTTRARPTPSCWRATSSRTR